MRWGAVRLRRRCSAATIVGSLAHRSNDFSSSASVDGSSFGGVLRAQVADGGAQDVHRVAGQWEP